MKLTQEQQAILDCRDHEIVIRAGAGASKTTTLEKYAEAHPGERFLYLAYNQSIKQEALGRFGRNVSVKTTHGIPYAAIGKSYAHKLGNIRIMQIIDALRLKDRRDLMGGGMMFRYASVVMNAINAYMPTIDEYVTENHIILDPASIIEMSHFSKMKKNIAADANKYWEMMQDLKCKDALMTHDGYLKLFMLQGKSFGNFDRILLDESQDANPVTLQIIASQNTSKILVGDSNQSIYGFRGAIDAMALLPNATKMRLTGSFRFGSEIALAANLPLYLKNAEDYVRGIGGEGKVLVPGEKSWLHLFKDNEQVHYLARGGYSLLEQGISLAERGKKMFFIGGVDSYRFSRLEDFYNMRFGLPYKDRMLKEIGTWEDVVAFAETDFDINVMVRIINQYQRNAMEKLRSVLKNTVDSPEKANVILSTTHKAKGLEFDNVVMDQDFYSIHKTETETKITPRVIEELNIAYVAMTRAKKTLVVPHPSAGYMQDENLKREIRVRMAGMVVHQVREEAAMQDHRERRRVMI